MAVAFALVAAFVPTTRQMAAIVMVPKIANNEKVQAAGNKLYDLAVEWMDELRPRKKAGARRSEGPQGAPGSAWRNRGPFFFFLRLDTDCDDMIQYADMKRTIGENGGGTE